MTRINCVPVEELHQKHLVAEYRELPRVFRLAEAAAKRGGVTAPDTYTLGAGHVKFFYSRLSYCQQRFKQLIAEMIRRGYNPQHTECPAVSVPAGWLQSWSPTEADLLINRQRIADRMPKS
jgi:hypothetical protein